MVLCGAPCLRVPDDTVLWYAAWVRTDGFGDPFRTVCMQLAVSCGLRCLLHRSLRSHTADYTCVELDA